MSSVVVPIDRHSERCAVCQSPYVNEINQALTDRTATKTAMAARLGISRSAIHRHHQWLRRKLAGADGDLAAEIERQAELVVELRGGLLEAGLDQLDVFAAEPPGDRSTTEYERLVKAVAHLVRLVAEDAQADPDADQGVGLGGLTAIQKLHAVVSRYPEAAQALADELPDLMGADAS